MIYLPARARRTTQYLHRAAWIVGTIAALLAAATAGMWAAGRITVGGAVLGAGIAAAGVTAVLAIGACIRSQAAQASTALLAELAQQRETQARHDEIQRRRDETLMQVVAELARLRAAVYGRDEEERRLVVAVAAEGYRRGRADATPDAATIRDIYWNAYTDALGDLGGSAPSER